MLVHKWLMLIRCVACLELKGCERTVQIRLLGYKATPEVLRPLFRRLCTTLALRFTV